MALAGLLPHPVQQAVSKAARGIGISLPDGEQEPSSHPAQESTGTNEAGPSTNAPRLRGGAGISQPSGDARSRASEGDERGARDGADDQGEASGPADKIDPASGEPAPSTGGAAPVAGAKPAPERDGSDDEDDDPAEDDSDDDDSDDDESGWDDEDDPEENEDSDDEELEEDGSEWDDSYDEDEMEERDPVADGE